MASLRLTLVMAATVLCLAGCANLTAQAPQKDYAALGLLVKNDMITCTDHDGSPWQCKSWIYAGDRPKNNLRLIFYQAEDKAWHVVSWQVY